MTPPSSHHPVGTAAIETAVVRMLEERGHPHEVLRHDPIRSAHHAAQTRGTPLEIGGKALVVKADKSFCVVAMSSADRLDSNAFRRFIGARRLRFANAAELTQLTGLVPGSVPPFGEPILPMPLFADVRLVENVKIAFTPGSLTRTIVTTTRAWRDMASPCVGRFAMPEASRNG